LKPQPPVLAPGHPPAPAARNLSKRLTFLLRNAFAPLQIKGNVDFEEELAKAKN
jgi:hypothetical protein